MIQKNNIIFFDGVCSFCNFWANFALRYNAKKDLYFSPLQSAFAKNTLKEHHQSITSISSVVFLKENVMYTQSSAALQIAKQLNWPWKIAYIFIVIPKPIRDFFYNIIARNRYKWFGKMDHCRVPTPAERDRFLE